MKRLLIIEGLPGSGKSYIIKELKKELQEVTFMKHTRPETKKRILDNNSPILDQILFTEILDDSQYLGKALNISHGTIVVERFILSTLITMILSKDKLPSNILSIVKSYYDTVLQIPFEDILCINVQHDKKYLDKILSVRIEPYYNAWGKYLFAAMDAEKLAISLIKIHFPEIWILNLEREPAYKAAVKFLKGGN